MGLPEQLAFLESAELVLMAQGEPELEYLFGHATEMLGARRWLLPICAMQSELAALGGLFSTAATLRAETSGILSFIAEKISDATLRETFLRRNRVSCQPEGV